MIVILRDTLCIEGVRSDDISPCFQIAFMDAADDIRTRQTEHVIVPLQLSLNLFKPPFPEIVFTKSIFRYDSAHGPVKNEYAFLYF